MIRTHAVLLAVGGLVVFTSAYLVSARAGSNQAPGQTDFLDLSPFSGKEIGLVLLVSPACGACNDPRLPEAWSRLVDQLGEVASREGVRFSLTGVGISHKGPQSGASFLARFGPFHELILGRGWDNLGAMKFIFQGFPGPGAVPQVLAFSRTVNLGPGSRLEFLDERILQRRVGIESILNWAGVD